jgi:hypothetical protein
MPGSFGASAFSHARCIFVPDQVHLICTPGTARFRLHPPLVEGLRRVLTPGSLEKGPRLFFLGCNRLHGALFLGVEIAESPAPTPMSAPGLDRLPEGIIGLLLASS